MSNQEGTKQMRRMEGLVVSDAMDKTVVVSVEKVKLHKKYLKRFKVTKRYKAHDEKNEYAVGDRVVIKETNPISKEKRWTVIEKVS
jgi:small subunit ribosomal protein S17